MSAALSYQGYQDRLDSTSESTTYVLGFDERREFEVSFKDANDVVTTARYDVWITGSLHRAGLRGFIDINECVMREIYVFVPGFEDSLKLDQDHFHASHLLAYHRLENVIELYVLNLGRMSETWEPK